MKKTLDTRNIKTGVKKMIDLKDIKTVELDSGEIYFRVKNEFFTDDIWIMPYKEDDMDSGVYYTMHGMCSAIDDMTDSGLITVEKIDTKLFITYNEG